METANGSHECYKHTQYRYRYQYGTKYGTSTCTVASGRGTGQPGATQDNQLAHTHWELATRLGIFFPPSATNVGRPYPRGARRSERWFVRVAVLQGIRAARLQERTLKGHETRGLPIVESGLDHGTPTKKAAFAWRLAC
jgi:hypothetical protein